MPNIGVTDSLTMGLNGMNSKSSRSPPGHVGSIFLEWVCLFSFVPAVNSHRHHLRDFSL